MPNWNRSLDDSSAPEAEEDKPTQVMGKATPESSEDERDASRGRDR